MSSSSVPSPAIATKAAAAAVASPASSWSCLPDVAWHGVAACLSARDVLALLSVNRELRELGRSGDALWDALLFAQYANFRHHYYHRHRNGEDHEEEEGEGATAVLNETRRRRSQRQRTQRSEEDTSRSVPCDDDSHSQRLGFRSRLRRSRRFSGTEPREGQGRRQEFLALSYGGELPAVEWVPLLAPSAPNGRGPSAREGHLSCVLAGRYLVIVGGYSTDASVYVKDLWADPPQLDFHVLPPSHQSATDGNRNDDRRRRRGAQGGGGDDDERLQFAYGASLTPLNDHQAVQFGGFRAGGYSHECRQVAVLTLDVVEPQEGNDRGGHSLSVSWRVVTTATNAVPPDADDPERADLYEAYLRRAYHTATLVFDRYLLILGGMQSNRSVWNPAVLDTRTWRWTVPRLPTTLPPHVPERHGHSAVWDHKRYRIVVFGGGTGHDLLRSGIDRADVWATAPMDGPGSLWSSVVGDGVPSRWRQLVDAEADAALSPAELLCLGRCHVGHCVGPDTVLLAFGSGRPSTNGVIAFNLASNEFFRPRVRGPLPCPRFTTTCVLWNSYLICHGGFSSQRSSALGDMHALDLAPALRRSLQEFRRERPGNPGFGPVTDAEVTELRNRGRRHGMGELEALISLLHNRANMNGAEFDRAVRHLIPAEMLRRAIRADDSDDDGDEDEDNRNLDAEMEE